MSRSTVLRDELRAAGAKPGEMDGLVAVAGGLGQLRTKSKARRWSSLLPVGLTGLIALTLGMAVVTFSQTSLPGNWLYPVKKASETVAIAVHPEYRGVVMMERAQEVQKLIAAQADPKLVLATLADYRDQAAAYKSGGTNYSVFEFCKANLQQAQAKASGTERQAITDTLASLSDA